MGGENCAVLVDGERVIAVLDGKTESRLQIIELLTADAGEVARRDAYRADRIPHADHPDVRGPSVFKQPSLLRGHLHGVAITLHLIQRPDHLLVAPFVAIEELAHADRRTPAAVDRRWRSDPQRPGRVRAPAEPEHEDLVSFPVVFDQPFLGQADIVVEPLSEGAAEKAVYANGILDQLPLAVLARRRA